MISLKLFVNAIHDAIMNASDSLTQKNKGLLDAYFTPNETTDPDSGEKTTSLTPKIVTLEYPILTPPPPKAPLLKLGAISPATTQSMDNASSTDTEDDEDVALETQTKQIQVPLITLVPLSMPQIEKAVLTADFEIQIVEGELQLNFPSGSIAAGSKGLFKKSKSTPGKLEITITPHEPTEGLKQIVEAYEAILKRQIG
jgi:hypothetical protein